MNMKSSLPFDLLLVLDGELRTGMQSKACNNTNIQRRLKTQSCSDNLSALEFS